MRGLDLAKFKKVSQDGKSATLHHPDGHMIRIAVSGLSPEMKKKLAALPLHQAKPEGPVEKLEEEKKDEAPEVADDTEEEDGVEPEAPAPQPAAPSQPPVAAVPPAQPAAPVAAAPSPVVPAEQPQAAAPAPVATPEQRGQQDLQHAKDFWQDLRQGDVQAKTYSDLYHDKSLPGKLGTIFGLMLGGVGSGLTGQPNAALEMMNKEIERDFESQKQNQGSKLNWYNAGVAHERTQAENALTNAHTQGAAQDTLTKLFNNMQSGAVGPQGAATGANMETVHSMSLIQDTIEKLPPGPARDQWQAKFDTEVLPFMMNKIMERSKNAAGQANIVGAISSNTPQGSSNPPPSKGKLAEPGKVYDAFDMNRKNALVQKGQYTKNDVIKDGKYTAIGPEGAAHIEAEAGPLRATMLKYGHHAESFAKLANMGNAGQVPGLALIPGAATGLGGAIGGTGSGGLLSAVAAGVGNIAGKAVEKGAQGVFERDRQIEYNSVREKLRQGGLSEQAANEKADAMLPTWVDVNDPARMKSLASKVKQYYETEVAEQAPYMRKYGLNYELPNYDLIPKAKPSSKPAAKPGVGEAGAAPAEDQNQVPWYKQLYTPQEHKK